MNKNFFLTTTLTAVLLLSVSSVQAQPATPCNQRLIRDVNFAYTGSGATPARWQYNQTNAQAEGFVFDAGAFAYVATGDFSNTKLKGAAGANNNTRQHAVVTNPNTLSSQYANIPTSNGMLVINPLQGNSDNYFSFSMGGLVSGNTYKIEFKIYNVISQSCSGSNCCAPGNCWSNFGDVFKAGPATIVNSSNPGDKSAANNLNWTGTSGGSSSGNWNIWGNPIYEMLVPTTAGASITLTADITVPSGTSSFTLNFEKGSADDPIVLGIEYIRVYGCEAEAIITSTGVQDGGKVCESSGLTLTAQGLGSASSSYTWTEKIGAGAATPLSGNGKSITITAPAGRGTVAVYTATGEWASKSITLTSQLCCYDVGDRIEVLKYSFPINTNGCNNTSSPRGSLDGSDGVRIDPKYRFECTGTIDDENAAGVGSAGYAGEYAVIRDTYTDGIHFGGWKSNGLQEHTAGYTGESGTGMLCVNASASPGTFFEYDLPASAVCDDGSSYQFSAWYASADPQGPDPCNIEFQLIDKNTDVIIERTSTGQYGWSGDWSNGNVERWKQTTLVFSTEHGKTYMLRLRNNGTGVSGNDVLIDDILITKCAPKIDFFPDGFESSASEAEVCYSPVKFKIEVPPNAATPSGNFSDLFPLEPTLYFQLQWCDDYNEATGTGTWQLDGAYKTLNAPYNTIPEFDIVPDVNNKSYRVKVTANAATVITTAPPSSSCGILEFYTRKFDIKKNGDMGNTNPPLAVGNLLAGCGSSAYKDYYTLTGYVPSPGDLADMWTWSYNSDSPPASNFSNDPAKTTLVATQNGTYYFIVKNGDCQASKSVTISDIFTDVYFSPITITQPASVCDGEPLNLTAPDITGVPVDNEFWTLGGLPFTSGTTVTAADNGKTLTYYAENACDNVTSNTVTLQVGQKYNQSLNFQWCAGTPYADANFNIPSPSLGVHSYPPVNLSSVLGCDSIITLTLDVREKLTETVPLGICSSQLPYTWRGHVFPDGITSRDTVFNEISLNGCDSIVTLNLSVYYPEDASISIISHPVMSCEGRPLVLSTPTVYSQGNVINRYWLLDNKIFDSGTTANLDIHNNKTLQYVAKTACFDILSNTIVLSVGEKYDTLITDFHYYGAPYAKNGFVISLPTIGTHKYTQNLISFTGCDSIVTLSLTVEHRPNPYTDCPHIRPEHSTSFSPNGDGYYDIWTVPNIEYYDYWIEIYDRRGALIRRWDNDFKGWDGTYSNGKPAPATDYWYIIYLRDTGYKEFKGHFNLKR